MAPSTRRGAGWKGCCGLSNFDLSHWWWRKAFFFLHHNCISRVTCNIVLLDGVWSFTFWYPKGAGWDHRVTMWTICIYFADKINWIRIDLDSWVSATDPWYTELVLFYGMSFGLFHLRIWIGLLIVCCLPLYISNPCPLWLIKVARRNGEGGRWASGLAVSYHQFFLQWGHMPVTLKQDTILPHLKNTELANLRLVSI